MGFARCNCHNRSSSSPPGQSGDPSQIQLDEMQDPFRQRYSPGGQGADPAPRQDRSSELSPQSSIPSQTQVGSIHLPFIHLYISPVHRLSQFSSSELSMQSLFSVAHLSERDTPSTVLADHFILLTNDRNHFKCLVSLINI